MTSRVGLLGENNIFWKINRAKPSLSRLVE